MLYHVFTSDLPDRKLTTLHTFTDEACVSIHVQSFHTNLDTIQPRLTRLKLEGRESGFLNMIFTITNSICSEVFPTIIQMHVLNVLHFSYKVLVNNI